MNEESLAPAARRFGSARPRGGWPIKKPDDLRTDRNEVLIKPAKVPECS